MPRHAESQPIHLGAHIPEGRYLVEHGRAITRTLTLAYTAKEFSPDDPRISDTLGWILCRGGAYQRALNLLEDSAASFPTSHRSSMVYLQLGHRERVGKPSRRCSRRAFHNLKGDALVGF